MNEAALPNDLINLAVELRRGYGASLRTSQYMKAEEQEQLLNRVRSEIVSLRARFVADQALEFGSECIGEGI